MDKFSISNFFPDADIKKNLDIKTLTSITCDDFNSEKLLKDKQHREKQVKKSYKKVLNTCLTKIDSVNKKGGTDIMFEVPQCYFLENNYSPEKCLKYIEKKLRKHYIDTYIVSKTGIYISWEDIEKNKELNNYIG